MHVFDLIAEARIGEALRNGEFDNLPGAGRPLELDDDALVPAESRAAYRLLRNAGLVPRELEALREIGSIERALGSVRDPAQRRQLVARIRLLRLSARLARKR
ncbi:MAG TPA: DnaJ family domain-containing protein [Burkholderiales bacterium]|nr:DnaJ family domain-containing protein [Burkholderiales bacterium]